MIPSKEINCEKSAENVAAAQERDFGLKDGDSTWMKKDETREKR